VLNGPELAPYIERLPGLRVMRPVSVVEETFCFLCTPNNNLVRILKMVRALSAFGDEMGCSPAPRFPTVERIALIDEQELRAKGFGYRAKTIPNIARQITLRGGERWLESLRDTSYRKAHDELLSIQGIGPKLADCICLFALHHTEAVPVDTHLWQAAKRLYFPDWTGRSLTELRYRQIGDHFRDRFGDLAGWAHQYLFYDDLKNWRTYRKG
jgi:N-glycosylase/DNA lyase